VTVAAAEAELEVAEVAVILTIRAAVKELAGAV
jgi:hypothetical protein